jgi:hypothetical protein
MGTTKGGCLCGAIRFEFDGPPDEVLHCHCEFCRKQTSSPIATFVMVERAKLRFTRGEPKAFASSPGVERSFCADCGAPIAYGSERRPEIIDLFLGTLDDPGAVKPWCHVQVAEQVSWFEVLDDLPRFEGSRRGTTPIRHGPRAPR